MLLLLDWNLVELGVQSLVQSIVRSRVVSVRRFLMKIRVDSSLRRYVLHLHLVQVGWILRRKGVILMPMILQTVELLFWCLKYILAVPVHTIPHTLLNAS